MPTNTFENIATTTVSDNTITQYTFSGLNTSTYNNFMMIIGAAGNGTEDATWIRINGLTSSYIQQQIRAGDGNNSTSVPVTSLSSGLSQAQLSYHTLPSATNRGGIYRIHINYPASGGLQGMCEYFAYGSGSVPNSNWTSFTRASATMTSITIGTGGGGFRIGSVFSLYGMI